MSNSRSEKLLSSLLKHSKYTGTLEMKMLK